MNIFSSVKGKLSAVLIVAIIIPVLTLGFLSYQKTYKTLEQKLQDNSKGTLTQIDNSISEFAKGFEHSIGAISQNKAVVELAAAAGGSESPALLGYASDIFIQTASANKNIMSAYMGTQDKRTYMYPVNNTPEGYDPTSRGWYKLALENRGKIVWTEPYVDAGTGKMVITVCKTVESGASVIGVAALDISLEDFAANFKDTRIGNTGYLFITDKSGVIVSHKDMERVGDSLAQESVWKYVSSGNSGFSKYDKGYVSYATNGNTGFKIAADYADNELDVDVKSLRIFIIILLIAAAVIGVVVSLMISTWITRNLQKLDSAFGKASKGDLSASVSIDTNDEFGKIGANFNTMLENLVFLISNIKASSDTVSETAYSLNKMALQTSSATQEAARAIAEIAEVTNEQARETEVGVDKATYMGKSVQQVSSAISEIVEMFKKSTELNDKGLLSVKKLADSTSNTIESENRVSGIINEVEKSSQEIGIIIQTINQIAEQTNLLALNASIEAARAGEAGRGFSVVADEIRKLAEETAQSTGKIKSIVDQIQHESKSAVLGMQDASNALKEQVSCVEDTEVIFKEISQTIEGLEGKVNEIQLLNGEMVKNKDEIMETMQNISATAEENSAGTEEVSASTEEILAALEEFSSHSETLKKLAAGLQSEIEKFRS